MIVRNERDIEKLELGESYTIEGPKDPERFDEVYQRLKPLVDARMEKLAEAPKPRQRRGLR